jgi:beta-1,4-mannosyltransferase
MISKIACWPFDDRNPYQRLFYAALGRAGIQLVPGLTLDSRVLQRLRPNLDAVHFHWPEYAWRSGVSGRRQRLIKLARFVKFLHTARQLELKVVWTIHNLRPHEPVWGDGLGFLALTRAADVIICHSEQSAMTAPRGGGKTVLVMRHGNYDGWYPPPRRDPDVVKALGLSAVRPTVALVGALRPYKGVDLAVDAVEGFRGSVQMIVAGEPHDGFDMESLRRRADSSAWLRVLGKSLSDQEFVDVVTSSTLLVLPYRNVTTSGVLMAAWTLSRGVVTTPGDFFEEMCRRHPLAGSVARAHTAQSLHQALVSYLDVPDVRRHAASRAAADSYSWDSCVEPVVDLFRRL